AARGRVVFYDGYNNAHTITFSMPVAHFILTFRRRGVVNNHDTVEAKASFNGTAKTILVPRPGTLSISQRPPLSFNWRLMFPRPLPAEIRRESLAVPFRKSKPRPSSETTSSKADFFNVRTMRTSLAAACLTTLCNASLKARNTLWRTSAVNRQSGN